MPWRKGGRGKWHPGRLISWQKLKWSCVSLFKRTAKSLTQDQILERAAAGETTWVLGSRVRGFEDQKSFDAFQTRLRLFSYCEAFVFEDRVVTDTDWGCTLRAGQMLFCNFLVFRSGLFVPKVADALAIGGLFLSGGIFSIQELLKAGKKKGLGEPGQFWRPDSLAQALRLLLDRPEAEAKRSPFCQPLLTKIVLERVAILNQTTELRIKKVREAAANRPVVLVLLHLALGESRDVQSQEFLSRLMQLPYFCGFLGSEGQRAYYFVGFSGEKLLHLDPHRVAREPDLASGKASGVDRFHTSDFHLINRTLTVALSVTLGTLGEFAQDLSSLAACFPYLAVIPETDDDLSNASTLSNQPVQPIDGDSLALFEKEMRDAAQARFADPNLQVGSFFKVDTFREDLGGPVFTRAPQLF